MYQKTNIHAHVLEDKDFKTVRDLDMQELKNLVSGGKQFWIEIPNLDSKDIIESVFKVLSIHHLILEDIFNPNQRAKIEILDRQVFCVLGLMQKKHDNRVNLQTLKLNMIISEKFLITINANNEESEQKINHQLLLESLSKNKKPKVDFLAFLIVEQMMDFFYIAIDDIAERLEN